MAGFTALRSSWGAGHSRGVAGPAARAAAHGGRPATEIGAIRRAGLLHDIGLHGVPASILDKAGPLSQSESERIRIAAFYTQRMPPPPPVPAPPGPLSPFPPQTPLGPRDPPGPPPPAVPPPW